MENFALNHLADLVYDYCGLNYLDNLTSLEMKIQKRLTELKMNTLWSYIRYLEANKAEWDTLVEILTINETYFYREDKQLTVYQNEVLPLLKANNFNQPIKVWSAACSTGEEPYSLAMTNMDSGICQPSDVTIIGTDINKKVLGTAEKGIYSKRSLSFRRIPQRWLGDYFHETPEAYQIKETVKDMVSFDYTNLLDEESMRRKAGFDVIFCRNVLIYFDTETVKKVVTHFYQSLKKGGFLFLGHAEIISNLDIGFDTINTNGTFYYRKG
ncbi:protein-glutamate O-methyltransferase CheR [Paenibacillus sp. YPG26]|uniref:CheR family methyltransferase n=1 Tax=Paenibacillus sp. YPG26 TaxID=2878915 RepID=UPI00203BA51E|nr:protein-glutamate O-methyltransferase CheR [Paenibacillus sp. YPG26]USB31750.1 protein-glutamate O-methyltransferase CheR [Paenibacillus sp. YPG26]